MKRVSICLLLMLSLAGTQAMAEEISPFASPSLHNPHPKTSAVQQDWPEVIPAKDINHQHWDEQHMAAARQTLPEQSVPRFSGRIEGWR